MNEAPLNPPFEASHEAFRLRGSLFRPLVHSVALTFALGCGAASDPGTDTNTNWVKSCTDDDQCDSPASCECRMCTLQCDDDADCESLHADAVCRPEPAGCARFSNICVPSDWNGETPNGADDDDDDDELWSARSSWSMFDADRLGRALVVADDGSLFVTGGQGRAPADLSVVFENFWLARFSAQGEPLWEQVEVIEDEGQSHGRSIALSPDGTITTVATIYDGSDTPVLRRHDATGLSLGEFSHEPGITLLTTSPNGDLVAAGSNLVEWRNGRPFTELWVGGLEGESINWERTLRGSDGSISTAWDVTVTNDTVYVAGSEGTASNSNASNPWLGAGTLGESSFSWETVPVEGGGNGRSVSVASTPDGGALVAGYGDEAFVHRYDANGDAEWQRTLEATPAATAASDAGYAVGYRFTGGVNIDDSSGRIDFFDWDGSLLWRFDDPSCEGVEDVIEHDGDLLALLQCSFGLGMFRIPIDQDGASLGGVGLGTEALRECDDSDDCEADHSCEAGTCAQNCTAIEQCPVDHRCVVEQDDGSDCPLLGPDEVGVPAVCLPHCFRHEDCHGFAPGLTCWNNACVRRLPECERRCLSFPTGCREGCAEIRGRGIAPADGCVESEEQLLGCYPEGRSSTGDDGCFTSPDGVVYSAGGLQGATLFRNFGFSECTPEELDLLSNAPNCEP